MSVTENTLIVDASALVEWWKFVECHPGLDAKQHLFDLHHAHIALAAEDKGVIENGLFLTEIPDVDLALMEVRFGKQATYGLYSRAEANKREEIVIEILETAAGRID